MTCAVKFLEVRVAADRDMFNYHRENLADYVLTLMNVVSDSFNAQSPKTLEYFAVLFLVSVVCQPVGRVVIFVDEPTTFMNTLKCERTKVRKNRSACKKGSKQNFHTLTPANHTFVCFSDIFFKTCPK